jgi:autotransporter-associated beta strand protein
MRLRTPFLVLAASLAVTARGVDVAADREINSLGEILVDNFTFVGEATLTIDLRNSLGAPIDATLNAPLRDDGQALGTFVKSGGGTLQYNGFASSMGYFANRSFDPFLSAPVPVDLRGASLSGFSGFVLVEQGQLQVSGYLNQWADYGAFNRALKGSAGAEMLGASAIVVEGGAKLSFRNSQLNLVGTSANLNDTNHDNPGTPLVARLNFAHNLLAATTALVETGPTTNSILVAHIDFAAADLDFEEGTLGILEGRGRFYKTGADALRITNTATFTGEFISAGGRLILDATSGDTLLSALSVNLASGLNGTNVAFDISDDPDIGHWKPGYAPGGQATTLVVNGTQRIRNLQSLFGEGGVSSIVVSGTGGGNLIELASESDILRINQEEGFDGYFTGSVVGARNEDTGIRGVALGTFIKEGAGALALFSVGNNMSLLEVRAGRLISNVQSLGSGTVSLTGTGTLSIVQNDAGALRATIIGDSALAELRFKPNDSIRYRGGDEVSLGNADAGVADIVAAQPFFLGQVIVEDGNSIVFSSGNNNAFENASRIRLLGGESGRETSIRFNDTDQRFRNLEGDASTRIYLGRGNITVVSDTITSFGGGISGVGNLVKEGAPAFTLAGQSTYFGATIVRQGALAAASQGIANTSGLVLVGTSSFTGTGAQSVGGLFGRAGTVVNAGGNLTIGVSEDLRLRLVSELANLPVTVTVTSPAYYLATETADVVPGFSPATTLGFLVRQYGLATDVGGTVGVIDESDVAAYLDFDGSGSTTLADLSLEDIEANRDLLAFSGTLNLSGGLTKVGAERLRLLGTVNFTGLNRLVDIQGGTLDVAVGVLASASSVNIGSAGIYALLVGADATLTTPLTGTGIFRKLGAGRLDLTATATSFTGLYDVVEGDLGVTFAAGSTPGVTEQGSVGTAAGTAFFAQVASNLSWSGEVFGDGDFIKQGDGVLTMTEGLIFTTGLTDVQQGGLIVGATPGSDLTIASGASFTAALTEDDFFDAVLSGAGTFFKSGDFDLRLDTAQPFTGTFNVTAGSLSLFAEDALLSASAVNLSPGTILRILSGFGQTLANVNADSTVTLEVDTLGTALTLFAGSGSTNNFAARILGFPDIVKTGTGKLSFIRPDDSPNEINSIDIQAGELEASRAGLGGADINIGTGATLRFFAAADVTDAYDLTITGSGSVAKSGAGTVDLRDATLADIDTAFDIQGGTLIVSENALGVGATPRATLANGSTFAYLATNDASLSAADITGSGSLTLGGYAGATPVLTLQGNLGGTVGYTGLTSLVDGVSVTLATGLTSLPGLSAESGTILSTGANTTLAVTQSVDATFAGDLLGNAALTLRGTGLLDVTGNGGNLAPYGGTVTVDGGKLGVSTENTKAISLLNGATLVLSGGAPTNYSGALTGTGATLELRDGVTINLTPAGALALSTLDDGHFSRVTLLTGSTLSFALSSSSLDKAATLDVAGGSLGIVVNQPSSTLRLSQLPSGTEVAGVVNLAAATGFAGSSVTIEGDIAGDLSVSLLSVTLRGDVGGDVTVAPATSLVLGAAGSPVSIGGSTTVAVGSVLSGTGNLGSLNNAGAVAPGYSPGTIIVTDLVNSGALLMELGATQSDQILFSGTASLNDGGTGILSLTQFGTGSLHGIRHVLLRDTDLDNGSFTPDSNLGRFSGVGTGTLRVLLVYPDALRLAGESALASLSRDGEVAAYAVRAPEEYDLPSLPSSWLTRLRAITTVNEGTATLGPQFNAMGARLAILGDAQLASAVDNLRPAAQASIATGGVSAFRANTDAILRRLEARRFDAAGPSVLTNDWFVEGTNAKVDVDSGLQARHTGLTAGVIHEFGFDGYWGYNLGVDTADTEGASGSFDGNGFRLGLFGGFMNQDRDLSLDFGLSFGSLSGDLTRASVFDGRNVADPDSTTIGAWVRLTSATTLGRNVAFTPFAQLETSRTNLGSLSETGQDDALEVADADLSQTALRAGFGLHRSWTSDTGAWNYRLALEVSYNLQLTGDDLDLAASIPEAGFSQASSNFGVLPGNGFTLAPSFSFGTSPDSTFNVGLRLDQASEGDALSLQFGYRRKF